MLLWPWVVPTLTLAGIIFFLWLLVRGIRNAVGHIHPTESEPERDDAPPIQRQQLQRDTARPRLTLGAMLALHSYVKPYYRYQHAPQNAISEAIFVMFRGGRRALEQRYGYTTYVEQLIREDQKRVTRRSIVNDVRPGAPAVFLDDLQDDDEEEEEPIQAGRMQMPALAPLSAPSLSSSPSLVPEWDLPLMEKRRAQSASDELAFHLALHAFIGRLFEVMRFQEHTSRIISRSRYVPAYFTQKQWYYLVGSATYGETARPGILRLARVVITSSQLNNQDVLRADDATEAYRMTLDYLAAHPNWQQERDPKALRDTTGNGKKDPGVVMEEEDDEEEQEEEERNNDNEYEYRGSTS